jgi:hypothetical protein
MHSQEEAMATCDYCSGTYRGWAIKDGSYRYCNGLCHSRGKALLSCLDGFPSDKLDAIIAREHAGPCLNCGQNRNVDIHESHKIQSFFVYSSWQTSSFVACQTCAHRRQKEDLLCCLLAGWWSPRGILTTPFFVVFNILAMFRRQDPGVASDRFRKLIRMRLAHQLASQ